MSTLEQRLDKIKRRSQQIIIKRKKRRTMAGMACTAVAVCLGVGAFLFFKQPLPSKPTVDVLYEEITESSIFEEITESTSSEYSLSCPVKTLQVTNVGNHRICTDPKQLSEIHLLLDTITSRVPDDENAGTDNDVQGGYLADDAEDMIVESECITQELSGCHLLLTMQDGTTLRYTLQGDVLTRWETNQCYTLTPQELTRLNELTN